MVTAKKRVTISVYETTFRLLDHQRGAAAWDTFLLELAKREPVIPSQTASSQTQPTPPPVPIIPPRPAALPAPISKPPPLSHLLDLPLERYCPNTGGLVKVETWCKQCRDRTPREYYSCQLKKVRE